MLASIFDPLRRFLANPQLPWIMLWVGLAFLIIALVVMIRTSWGQSRPLRKCAALSLLAHLLLAVYATTVEIVLASGDGRGDGIGVMLVSEEPSDGGAAWGDPHGDPWSLAGEDEITQPGIESPDRATPNENVAQIDADSAQPALIAPQPESSPAQPALPPLLEVAETKPDEPPPIANPDEAAPPDTEAAHPSESSVAENAEAKSDASEPLPSLHDPSPVSQLPEPASTSDAADWTSGQPAGDLHSAQPAAEGPVAQAAPDDSVATAAPTGRLIEVAAAPIASRAVPKIYAPRVSSDRADLLRRNGGSPEGEACVQAALHWLALNQSADGRWDPDQFGAGREMAVLGQNRQGAGANSDTGISGLALLAFLGAGETHNHGQYPKAVQRGLEFLIGAQRSDGNLAGDAETFAFMYCHGMATLALSEAYAMTGDKRLEAPLKRAIAYTVAAQNSATGGWRYRPNDLGDTSQLGWQLMALKSAEAAGIEIPQSASDGAVRFLKSVSSGPFGGIGSYRPGERPSRPMTAEALVCRQFLGMARDNPAANEAGDFLLGELPNAERINLYYWYYGTLGMFQLQGPHWERWNRALQGTLVARQRADGNLAGSWDPDCIWGGYGGRVYSTAMSALCLEVYYRYLPIYRVANR